MGFRDTDILWDALIGGVSTEGNPSPSKQFPDGILETGRQDLIGTIRPSPFSLRIPLFVLDSFLGYRFYLNLTRILNLNVTKVIGRIKKFMKG